MPEWIHAILVGGGIGLFFAARELEKWAKKSEMQEDAARLKEFEEYSAHSAQQARARTVEVAPLASTKLLIPNSVFTTRTNLSNDVEAFRERYRQELTGIWSTTETIPIGCAYNFRADGTGMKTEYRGFGGWDIPFLWRSIGDWSIEVKFDYPAGYWEQYSTEAKGNDDAMDEEIGEEWERINYDFIVPKSGYCSNTPILCSAYDAQRYRDSEDSLKENVIKDAWFGLDMCDGPLTPG